MKKKPINSVTGYHIYSDECGKQFNGFLPTIDVATINQQRLQEINRDYNTKMVNMMY